MTVLLKRQWYCFWWDFITTDHYHSVWTPVDCFSVPSGFVTSLRGRLSVRDSSWFSFPSRIDTVASFPRNFYPCFLFYSCQARRQRGLLGLYPRKNACSMGWVTCKCWLLVWSNRAYSAPSGPSCWVKGKE